MLNLFLLRASSYPSLKEGEIIISFFILREFDVRRLEESELFF